ncbi:MAG TPA: MarR family transcriptional regulator, partial [Segetibacter sp.]
ELTHEQFNVMRILKGKHPEVMCVKDIGSRMIERNSNVPRIIDKLVSKQFVNRTTSTVDKRETVVGLTATGLEVLEKANTEVVKLFDTGLPISEEEALTLSELLESFRHKEH